MHLQHLLSCPSQLMTWLMLGWENRSYYTRTVASCHHTSPCPPVYCVSPLLSIMVMNYPVPFWGQLPQFYSGAYPALFTSLSISVNDYSLLLSLANFPHCWLTPITIKAYGKSTHLKGKKEKASVDSSTSTYLVSLLPFTAKSLTRVVFTHPLYHLQFTLIFLYFSFEIHIQENMYNV